MSPRDGHRAACNEGVFVPCADKFECVAGLVALGKRADTNAVVGLGILDHDRGLVTGKKPGGGLAHRGCEPRLHVGPEFFGRLFVGGRIHLHSKTLHGFRDASICAETHQTRRHVVLDGGRPGGPTDRVPRGIERLCIGKC